MTRHMTRSEMDGLLILMLFYEAQRIAAIKDAQFWQRRADESRRAWLLDQAFVEREEADLWMQDAEKWQQHINDIKARLLETCHD
ncbi:hypothetical protein AB9R84_09005 [Oceanimonas smirnovii]|uniref:hypothetical protein n=1 Tax=Oceanimonas smirnovii TaxID=264574 RepID=UPI003AB0017F